MQAYPYFILQNTYCKVKKYCTSSHPELNYHSGPKMTCMFILAQRLSGNYKIHKNQLAVEIQLILLPTAFDNFNNFVVNVNTSWIRILLEVPAKGIASLRKSMWASPFNHVQMRTRMVNRPIHVNYYKLMVYKIPRRM